MLNDKTNKTEVSKTADRSTFKKKMICQSVESIRITAAFDMFKIHARTTHASH